MKFLFEGHFLSKFLLFACLLETLSFRLTLELSNINGNYRRLQVNMKNLKKTARSINVLGKGFGKTSIVPKRISNALTLTPPGQVRKIEGHYQRLLERHSELYNELRNRDNVLISDIYARSEISKKAFFIGRLAHLSSESIEDAMKSLEILLLEYAKSLQPTELGSLLLLSYPQLFYAPGYSNQLIQQAAVNLTRYYHFNKQSKFIDYDQIGFQPHLSPVVSSADTSTTNLHTTSLRNDKDLPNAEEEEQVPDSMNEIYCDDTGVIWSSEEIEAFRSQPQPIYERNGKKDIHGLMDRFLDFPTLLDNSLENYEQLGNSDLPLL